MGHYSDDVATGPVPGRLRIIGRPRSGGRELCVLLEEPGEPVQMHWSAGKKLPHFRRACPNCVEGTSEPRPFWYVGAAAADGQLAIVELTEVCFRSLEGAARKLRPASGLDLFGADVEGPVVYRGLLLIVSRANFAASPRVLRCEQRMQIGRAHV